ncbi:MAG TPA: hypothetical protein VFE11_07415, partial [Dongiaceae bacterium]|nr:hypothetical protein [Dongiaceae bacterium]
MDARVKRGHDTEWKGCRLKSKTEPGSAMKNAGPMNEGQLFTGEWERNAAHLESQGLYDPAEEHDACGVGLIAAIDGKPRRQVVEAAIAALKSVWHR